jgi:density-regulated protein DRP1
LAVFPPPFGSAWNFGSVEGSPKKNLYRMPGKVVEYCPSCTFPFEYCEYSSDYSKCKLVPNRPDAHLADDAKDNDEEVAPAPKPSKQSNKKKPAKPADSDDDLNVDDLVEDLDGDVQIPAEAKAPAEEKKSGGKKKKAAAVPGEILIYRVARTKKKNVTYLKGLEAHEELVKVKDAVKAFKTKFACGAALQKSEDGLEELIVIQGDVQIELAEFLVKKYKVPEDVIFYFDPKSKAKDRAF